MEPLDNAVQLGQECLKRVPLILLGSGASAAYGLPGMWDLGQHLSATKLPTDASFADADSWGKFLEELPKSNLEQALTDVTLSPRMTRHVVESTWDYLNPSDLQIFESVCGNRKMLALSRLYQHLFKSTVRDIHVVTLNYDRLAEYAANAAEYNAFTGFTYGWLTQRATSPVPRIFEGQMQSRTVNVWKVHGSFGWFADEHGVTVGLPPMQSRPKNLSPIIVTPGIEKYKKTHDEPYRTIMQCADKQMRNAAAFLCIGYGFNDQHLQPLLIERCTSTDVPLVLLTHTVSSTAREFFASGKCQRFMALEQSEAITKMYSNKFPAGVELAVGDLWSLNGFLDATI